MDSGIGDLAKIWKTVNNLPIQVTSFVGRTKEIGELTELLQRTRLVTLIGAGGIGKTRLSLQVANAMLEGYSDGVYFIEAVALADAARIGREIARTLYIQEQPGQAIEQTLVMHLKDKRILLLFDNCEPSLSACRRVISVLLSSCPNIHILATSREALGVAEEQIYSVPPLSYPDPEITYDLQSLSQFEAARLFLERVVRINPDFAITAQNAPELAHICYRLRGIPLAIELAAARTRSRSVAEISKRLASHS